MTKGLDLCDGAGDSPNFLLGDGSLLGVVLVLVKDDRGDRREDTEILMIP